MTPSFCLLFLLHFFIYGLAQKVSFPDCISCCSAHFLRLPPGGERDLSTSRCQDGCLLEGSNFERLCLEELDESCLTGQSFREAGFAIFDTGVVNGDEIDFCVDGLLDVSFAPTSSPTEREDDPPDFFPETDDESPTEDTFGQRALDNIPIVVGGAGAGLLLIAAIVFLLKPKAIIDMDDDEFSIEDENDHEVKASIVQSVHTIGTATILDDQRKERERVAGKIIKYRVTKEFLAENPDELTVKVGEILEGVTPIDKNWWFVKRPNTGEEGMVALECLEQYEVIDLEERVLSDNPIDLFPVRSEVHLDGQTNMTDAFPASAHPQSISDINQNNNDPDV